ncbi:MAG: hypothetical protein HYY18_10385 [Planctomycetes bacterium]|nr:hypothetical protein [Planctomycetota bacterium]
MKRLIPVAALLAFLVAPVTIASADHWYRDGVAIHDDHHHHYRSCGHVYVAGEWIVDVRAGWDPYYHHCVNHSVYRRWCGSCRTYGYYWKLQHHPEYRGEWRRVNWRWHRR